jgi:hypothetical protein
MKIQEAVLLAVPVASFAVGLAVVLAACSKAAPEPYAGSSRVPAVTFESYQPSAQEAYRAGGMGSRIDNSPRGACRMLADGVDLCSEGYACVKTDPKCAIPFVPTVGECCMPDHKLATIQKAAPW